MPRLDGWMRVPAAMLEGLPDAVVATDAQAHIVFVNGQAEDLFGYPRAELIGEPVQMLWPVRLRDRYLSGWQRFFATDRSPHFYSETWGLRRDGTEFAAEVSWGNVDTDDGPLRLGIGRDITARRAREARLHALTVLGDRALCGAGAVALAREAVDLLGLTLPLTGAAVRSVEGVTLAAVGGAAEPGMRIPIGSADALYLAAERELSDDEVGFAVTLARTLANAFDRLHDGEQARREAVHDPLTGLANRTLLHDRLRHAIAACARGTLGAAVLFVDLDEFKRVNDSHGHLAGDAVLVEVARRLRGAVRPGDTIARYGGDEFVAVCERVDEAAARALGERILCALRHPVHTGDFEHPLSASVGIALGSAGADVEELLADADAAAYQAKAHGRGRIELA